MCACVCGAVEQSFSAFRATEARNLVTIVARPAGLADDLSTMKATPRASLRPDRLPVDTVNKAQRMRQLPLMIMDRYSSDYQYDASNVLSAWPMAHGPWRIVELIKRTGIKNKAEDEKYK